MKTKITALPGIEHPIVTRLRGAEDIARGIRHTASTETAVHQQAHDAIVRTRASAARRGIHRLRNTGRVLRNTAMRRLQEKE